MGTQDSVEAAWGWRCELAFKISMPIWIIPKIPNSLPRGTYWSSFSSRWLSVGHIVWVTKVATLTSCGCERTCSSPWSREWLWTVLIWIGGWEFFNNGLCCSWSFLSFSPLKLEGTEETLVHTFCWTLWRRLICQAIFAFGVNVWLPCVNFQNLVTLLIISSGMVPNILFHPSLIPLRSKPRSPRDNVPIICIGTASLQVPSEKCFPQLVQ